MVGATGSIKRDWFDQTRPKEAFDNEALAPSPKGYNTPQCVVVNQTIALPTVQPLIGPLDARHHRTR